MIILETFRKVSGLCINKDKSSVHLIRCEDIDLDHVLLAFSGDQRHFSVPLPWSTAVLQATA
jgi:hypothetical protein